jgi:hypothetical protein
VKPELLRAKERLARNLSHLSSYCWPRVIQLDCWPSRELLAQIKDDVLVLTQRERKKTIVPVWKAFLLVDKREKNSG